MPPYLPLLSLNRSQSTRIGKGPGNAVPNEFNMGDIPTNPDNGALFCLFYADLGQGNIRRDLQRHDAIGGVETIGAASLQTYSDLYISSGLALTPSGSNYTIAVGAGSIRSRFYGSLLPVAAQTVTLPSPPTVGGRADYVVVNNAGVASVVSGNADPVAPTYEVWTLTSTATGGTFGIQFQYNGFLFTATGIAYNVVNAALLTALTGATGGPGTQTFGNMTGGATIAVIGGGPLPATTTVTFQGLAEGPIVPVLDTSALTGGTMTVTRTTPGVGAQTPVPAGTVAVLGAYYSISSTANAAAATSLGATNFRLTS